MRVSLKEFKKVINNAKAAVALAPVDSMTEYIMLEATPRGLTVGGRGSVLSYVGRVPFTGSATFGTIYVPVSAVASLAVKNTKDDELTLDFTNGQLAFSSSAANGIVATVQGLSYCTPYRKLEGDYYARLSSNFLLAGLKLASEIKKGWTTKTRPYAADFIRLAFEDEAGCRLAITDAARDVEETVQFASGKVASILASDGARYYQQFEPVYADRDGGLVTSVYNTKVADFDPLYLSLSDMPTLVKLLVPDVYYQLNVCYDDQDRVEAVNLFNADTMIHLMTPLNVTLPDVDQQLSFLRGEKVLTFTPDAAFYNALTAINQIKETAAHGLTFVVQDGKIRISAPETAITVRYRDLPIEDQDIKFTAVLDGHGVAALKLLTPPLTLVVGQGFTSFYDSNYSRIILRNFSKD